MQKLIVHEVTFEEESEAHKSRENRWRRTNHVKWKRASDGHGGEWCGTARGRVALTVGGASETCGNEKEKGEARENEKRGESCIAVPDPG